MSALLPLPEDAEPPLRRTALLLHGLAAEDQAWLLRRLPVAQGARVRALLDELRSLGIEPDRQAVAQALAEALARSPLDAPAASPADVSARAVLAQASPHQLAQVLQDEPAALIARLLQIDAWAWQRELLPLLPAARRQELRLLQVQPPAPKLDAALIEAIAGQLPARPDPTPTPALPRAGRLGRWARGLGSRLGPVALRAGR